MTTFVVNYPNAAQILLALGHRLDIDFLVAKRDANSCDVGWRSAAAIPTNAEIDAVAATASQIIDTRAAQAAKAAASASIDRGATVSGDKTERIVRALVQLILDEFNRHSTLEAAMFSAVAAAASLADLKTRFAAITPVPQRSLADLVAAIKTALAATPE